MSLDYDIIAGRGLQVIDIDISSTDATLLAGLRSVTATIYHDDNPSVSVAETGYFPVTALNATPQTQIYQVTETVAGFSQTSTIFRVVHTFTDVGQHNMSISFEDTSYNRSWVPAAIRIGVGDGPPAGGNEVMGVCEAIGGVKSQYIGDKLRYSMNWSDLMKPEGVPYPALARERIVTSTWALAADSPATGITMIGAGFDDDLGVTWVSIESDGSLVAADVIYINNTIETTGLEKIGSLSETTSAQRRTRQYRIRFTDC